MNVDLPMPDETNDLLRQILETQKELLAEFRKEAQRTTDFRIDAIEQGKSNQGKLSILSAVLIATIVILLFFGLIIPRMSSPNFPFPF